MKDIASLAIPATTLCRLLQYADAHQAELNAGELAAMAIEEWLARTEGGEVPGIRLRGYQWKKVFLPEGTQLRVWNRSGYAYAEVIGDNIVHLGNAVSPHEFICRCKGISRSAWSEVALLFPGENHWRGADAVRRELARPREPQVARTPAAAPSPPEQPGPKFSSVLPPPVQRLPRIPPIPTQAHLQPDIHAIVSAENAQLNSPDRRKVHRRQEDLLLD
ncbi:hypothetical protein ASD58_23360 [Duganella sp. Root1480D1]|nr:hypothetical protein ASD58_23360 [Duganella sp. Root1480D1]